MQGMSNSKSSITCWLEQTNGVWFSIYAAGSAFCLYTCVYSFRKTFSVATFQGMEFWNVSYKSWLVIFQVIGYSLSKFIGIKIISELKASSRSNGILLMVSIALASWLLFALVAPPYNIIFLFINGLALGMVWGMVFGYLEGRRYTEVLGAGLSISFIFSAGLCKSVGGLIMRDWGVSDLWMPFTAGMLFFIPLLIFIFLLNQLPPPSPIDEQLRTKREPMNKEERNKFIATFLPGIILFVLAYMLMTVFRDLRDNYSAEVWKSLGFGNSPEIFTTTEIPISIIVLVVMGSLMVIRNNQTALMINHIIIIFGMILLGLSTYLFEQELIGAPSWMILIGLGLYFGYVPFNSIFFDRMIAAFQYAGAVGFIMYVADSFGYLGSVSVLFFKEFGFAKLSWINFFISSGYFISIAGTLLMTGSMIYFHQKHQVKIKHKKVLHTKLDKFETQPLIH
jgi:MFS family permease